MSAPPGSATPLSPVPRIAPRRRRGAEHLDDATLDPAIALRSLADIRRCNGLLGGTAAVLAALRPHLERMGAGPVSLTDVGTGAGDIPSAIRQFGRAMGVDVRTTGIEWTVPIASAAAPECGPVAVADARCLPLGDRSVDIVTCSQVLHHFAEPDALAVIREMHRVARVCVVIGELRRSWLAAAGVWLASWPLAFHPVSRHDGVVSVLRGFAGDELSALVRAAVGVAPVLRRHPAFRVTAAWSVA